MARTSAPAEGDSEPLVEEEIDLGGEVEEPIETEEEVEIDPEEPGEEPAEESEEPVEPPRRGGGGARTPRDLRRRAQDAERERDDLRRRVEAAERDRDDARRRVQVDPAAQARAAEEERQRVAALPFEDQIRYYHDLGRRETAGVISQMQFQHADALDEQRYESSAARSPARAAYRTQVDDLLRSERAAGRNHTRESLFFYLHGKDREEREIAAREKTVPTQRRAAAARVAGQQTRPTGARSDGGTGRRPASGGDAEAVIDEMRRRGIPLW